MKFEIIPKFGEAQLFIFAVSLIVTIALYGDFNSISNSALHLVNEFQFTLSSILTNLFVLMLIGIWLYGLYLSIKYALIPEIPSTSEAGLMVWSVLLPLTFFSFAASGYWYAELILSDSYLDKVMIFFPLIELVRCFITIIMMRMSKIEYREKFDYRNAKRGEIITAFSVLLVTGIVCRLFTIYSPVLVILMMYELANLSVSIVKTYDS